MKNMPVGEAVDEVNGYLLGESTRPYFVVIDGTSEYVEFLSHFFLLSTIRTSNYCDGDSFPDYGRLENDLHRLRGFRLSGWECFYSRADKGYVLFPQVGCNLQKDQERDKESGRK